jgi:hypothetical protein
MPTMKRIILFRFHQDLDVCKQRLEMLQNLNSSIPIYGLCGGSRAFLASAKRQLRHLCVSIHSPPKHDAHWHWKNGDLAIRSWFKDVGFLLDFDMLHVIEWDLLLASPIADLYRHVPKGSLGLSGVQKIAEVGRRWNWTTKETKREEYLALLKHVRRHYGYTKNPLCCFAPGACIPKDFLVRYAAHRIPPYSNDEVRLPLYAQIFGFLIADNRLCSTQYEPEEFALFNTDKVEVPLRAIAQELKQRNDQRAFHPCTKLLSSSVLYQMLNPPNL